MRPLPSLIAACIATSPVLAQTTSDPFPNPIRAAEGVIRVGVVDFAAIPDIDGQAARPMLLIPEPGGRRLFVNDMRGPLYAVSADGRVLNTYLDIDAESWGHDVQSAGRERGFQSFAIHPQFREQGSPGFGKLYTWTDVTNTEPAPDFSPGGGGDSHDTVLLEWTARNPGAERYDGGPPREILRVQQPFSNHNGGQLAFNPLARSGDSDFGLLYIGLADGGSGGDPLNLAQNLSSAFGKILRIDPLGSSSANGKYGIPASNPFVSRGNGVLGEVYALGVRNPQRFGWDSRNGSLFLADIGQNTVEEVSPVTAGANLGWNVWEGSFRFVNRSGVDTQSARTADGITFPVAEYDHTDPILTGRSAVTGIVVVRGSALPPLDGFLVFGDNPSGEIFAIPADRLPAGGQDPIRRVMLTRDGHASTLLELIRERNGSQGRQPAGRADLRFGSGHDGQVFLLNKQDGMIRRLTAPG